MTIDKDVATAVKFMDCQVLVVIEMSIALLNRQPKRVTNRSVVILLQVSKMIAR